MGVAEFPYIETLPEGFKGNLPTVEDRLEAEWSKSLSEESSEEKGRTPTWSVF